MALDEEKIKIGLDVVFRSRVIGSDDLIRLRESPTHFKIVSADLYSSMVRLCRLEQQMMRLQMENARQRDALGSRLLNLIGRKLRGEKRIADRIEELQKQASGLRESLSSQMDPRELGLSLVAQYIPNGDSFIRLTDIAKQVLLEYLWSMDSATSANPIVRDIVARFVEVLSRILSLGYLPDPRVMAFAASVAGAPEDQIEQMIEWDARLTRFIYGVHADPRSPLTYDKFIIHSILANATPDHIEDRFIGLRIGFEMFAPKYRAYFKHQLRTLIAVAQIVSRMDEWNQKEDRFAGEFARRVGRLKVLIDWNMRNSSSIDRRFGRGLKVSDEDVSFTDDVWVGIPENVILYGARLIGIRCMKEEVQSRFSQYMMGLEESSYQHTLASILADTDLFYQERRDRRLARFSVELPECVDRSLERLSKMQRVSVEGIRISPIHAGVMTMMPGTPKGNASLIGAIVSALRSKDIPPGVLRTIAFLIAPWCRRYDLTRRFVYELWEADGMM